MPTEIEVGQLWKDDKKSRPGRYFIALDVTEDVLCFALNTRSITRIRPDRFKPGGAGYSRVSRKDSVDCFSRFLVYIAAELNRPQL